MEHVNGLVPLRALTFQHTEKQKICLIKVLDCCLVSKVWKPQSGERKSLRPRHADMPATCNSIFAIEPYELFFLLTDGAVSEKTLAKDTGAGDVTERPRLHLYWLSVSASEMTSLWASLITYYINFTRTVCMWVCVCVSLYSPDPTLHSTLSSARSKGQQPRRPRPVRFTTYGGPWDTFLCFPGTWRDRVWPLQKKAISIIPTGLEDNPGVKLTMLTEYYGLQSPLTVNVQANLQCNVSTQPLWTCSVLNWI